MASIFFVCWDCCPAKSVWSSGQNLTTSATCCERPAFPWRMKWMMAFSTPTYLQAREGGRAGLWYSCNMMESLHFAGFAWDKLPQNSSWHVSCYLLRATLLLLGVAFFAFGPDELLFCGFSCLSGFLWFSGFWLLWRYLFHFILAMLAAFAVSPLCIIMHHEQIVSKADK